MRKGFTLIELLAVIVILAIIALIATPIVLNIINETKESATLRSAEMYLKAVEYTVADAIINGGLENKEYPIAKNGNLCKKELSSDGTCEEGHELKVEVKGEKPGSGSIWIENGNVKDLSLNLNDKVIEKNESGELVFNDEILNQDTQICTLASDSEKIGIEKGAKYLCKVDPNKEPYTFYVLSNNEEDGSTNLIMDKNICEDGTAATSSNTCFVLWNEDEGGYGDNSSGPITSITYLYNATKSWTNVEPLNYIYYDSGRYTSFISTKGTLTISGSITTTIGTLQEPLRARMPIYEELEDYNGENSYLYENLSEDYYEGIETNNIKGIDGYWSLTSGTGESYYAYAAFYVGDVFDNYDDFSSAIGVRPVINIKL